MSTILVLGSANLDLVVRQPRLPQPGETLFGSSFTTVPGGKGLNQAIAAARAGGDVAFVGAVGKDAFGSRLRTALEADRIDVSGLVDVDLPTGTAHISVLENGENAIVVVPGANTATTRLDADTDTDTEARIRRSRYLVAQLERPVELVTDAFAAAHDAGVTTVLTPAPARRLEPALLRLTDVLAPNAGEACALAGVDDDVAAAVELSRMAGLVVMTRGRQGALVARAGEVIADVPARTVTAVDTTAAGDTFIGVLVARLSLGATLDQALRAAAIASSIAVTRAGASRSMPLWDEIAALLGS